MNETNNDFFDHAFQDDHNNFTTILQEIDPDLNSNTNIAECSIIPGDEIHHFSNSLRNNFSCMSLNIASLKENYLNLQLNIIDQFAPSVLGLCETKITDELEGLYHLSGFNLYANNNRSNKGGVCLYINDRLTVVPKPNLSFIRPGIETLFVDIYSDNEIKTVGVVYRRASEISIDDFTEEMNAIFNEINFAHNKVYIMGDFNIDLLQYNRSAQVANFCNIFLAHSMYPLITRPTRTTAASATLIDNIFSNDINSITRAAVVVTDISDHYPIFVQKPNISVNNTPTVVTYRKFSDQNIQHFKESLADYDFTVITSMENANDAFNCFHRVLIELFEEHFPLITKELSIKQVKNPWMTPGLRASQKNKNRNC